MKETEAQREELLRLLEGLVGACETASHPDLLPRGLWDAPTEVIRKERRPSLAATTPQTVLTLAFPRS